MARLTSILKNLGWLIIGLIMLGLTACLFAPALLLLKAIWEWLT